MPDDYTPQELMVVCAARQIRDGEVVFVGMRLPLLAFALAKRTHAPDAVGLFENGLVRDTPSRELLLTMGDPPNILGAEWATRTVALMGLLAQGCAHLGFVGGAEVDRYGNLNTSYVGAARASAGEAARQRRRRGYRLARGRLAIIMAHEQKRFPERVSYITSPGYGDGGDWRARVGLPRGGPSAVITTLAVLGFARRDARDGAALLASRLQRRGRARADRLGPARRPRRPRDAPPTADELRIIRECDPQGFWTR